jgi:hypothetical protein
MISLANEWTLFATGDEDGIIKVFVFDNDIMSIIELIPTGMGPPCDS